MPLKVGLWNLESKIENTALMQVSQFHKDRGDFVELYSPLFEYDRIYVFSLFTFSKKPKLKSNMIAGGTGFNIRSRLPPEIEACDLDYSIYPNCKSSYIWFSRGCFRSCPFCVVPAKEGRLVLVEPKNLNPFGTRISVMDNTFTAAPNFYAHVDWLAEKGLLVDFQCGFDVRLPHTQHWKYIKNNLRIYHQIRTAWDDPREDVRPHLAEFADVFGKSKIMVYVIVGYWSTKEEDLYRIEEIRKLGLDAWVMPYNKQDPYQKAVERWNNRHLNCSFDDYDRTEKVTATQ